MICAVSIMIPSMAAGSVATIFGSAPGSDDVIILYTSSAQRTLYYSDFVVISDPSPALVSAVCCGLLARAEYLVSHIANLSVIIPTLSHI